MKIKIIKQGALILFFIISIVFINPSFKGFQFGYRAAELKKNTMIEGNVERTDFRNEQGMITIASDLGYATCVTTITERGRIEKFYDEKGKPISRYPGYYALFRGYDESGNNICLSYLDIEDKPVITQYGYATEKRIYNEFGKIQTVKYYDAEDNPIFSKTYGFGYINEFDDNGNNTKTIYVNAQGNAMITGLGYAIILKRFYSDGLAKGQVEYEFYLDENEQPIALPLGQFGIHKEYDENGQCSVLIYLDAEGHPIRTNNGYTMIKRTFHADNSIATEQYYDLEGNPFPLSEGQYGIKKERNQTVYLDKNGKEIFNLKNLLYNHSWVVILFATIVIFISAMTGKRLNCLWGIIYIFVIFYLTLMFRENNETKGFGLFMAYGKVLTNSNVRADILKNIWLFIPLGAIAYRLNPKRIILMIPVALSVLIEGIQFVTRLGFCELDDVISNGLGGWIGFAAGKLTIDLMPRIKKRKQKIFSIKRAFL